MDDPEAWRWVWLVATAVFTAGEMAIAGSFFLAPFAVGAAVAMLLSFAGASVLVQWAAFVGVSLVTFAGFRPLARKLDDVPQQNVGATRLTTREAVITEDIPERGVGMARLDREDWRAETVDGRAVAAGTQVTVVEVRGTRLIVAPAPPAPPASTEMPTTPPTFPT